MLSTEFIQVTHQARTRHAQLTRNSQVPSLHVPPSERMRSGDETKEISVQRYLTAGNSKFRENAVSPPEVVLRLRDTVRGVVRAPNARYLAVLNRT